MTALKAKAPKGSARFGAQHWIAQRLSALIMIPLSIWFVAVLVSMPFSSYEVILTWMSGAVNASLLLILLMTILYHAALGMQVVYEDYIHHEGAKLVCVYVTKFLFIFLAVIAFLSIAKVYFLLG